MILYFERNNNHRVSELRKAVHALYEDNQLIWIGGANVFRDCPEDVIQHFMYCHQMSAKSHYVQFYCIGIDFEIIHDLSFVKMITAALINILSVHYQVVSGIIQRDRTYYTIFLINSIGIDGRTVFRHRVQTYLDLIHYLRRVTGEKISVEIGRVDDLFSYVNKNPENSGSYVGD